MSLKTYAAGADPNLPRYSFYDGAETLIFDKAAWTYFRVMPDGSFVPQDGVTTVLHATINKAEPLMAWAVKRAMAKLKRLMTERGFIVPVTSESAPLLFDAILDDIIQQAKQASREELEDAADVGNAAHDWIEQYIKAVLADNEDRKCELLAKLPDDMGDDRPANCCVAAICWMADHAVEWLATERKCFSRKHGVAGTSDALGLVSSCSNPDCCPKSFSRRLSLCDWKSSNSLRVDHVLQTAIYAEMYREETGEKIEDRWILRLDKETAEFDPWHIEGDKAFQEDLQGYLNALAHYRSLRTIENRISDVEEQKRNRAKAIRATERAVRCLDADRYKGVRQKKGCNGTDSMCETCTREISRA